MKFSFLQRAWGILIIKYHQPDSLLLWINTSSGLPMWTCKNNTPPSDSCICLVMAVSMDGTLKEWNRQLEHTLGESGFESEFVSEFECRFETSICPSSVHDEQAWRLELEQITDLDNQLNQHWHGEISAERFRNHLTLIYEALLHHPDTRIRDIDILLPEERRQLLHDFNQTSRNYPRETTIHGLFKAQAAKTPDHIAVVCNKERITYRDLDDQSSRLAARLCRRGVGQGTIVAITADRTVEMIIGLLAILKSGAAYLPLDTRAPEKHNLRILKDSGARIAVTRSLSKQLDMELLDIELLDPYDASSYEAGLHDTEEKGSSSDPAYVIYTSGTTGAPKGVMVRHQGVVNFSCWFDAKYRIADHPHVLQSANLTFDASVESIFCTLLAGGTVILIRSELLLHKNAFRNFINKHQVHIVPLVPSLLTLLSDDEKLESIRIIITGGDILERELKDRLLQQGYRLYNHYGPTETTVVALASEVEEDLVTLGKPIGNTRVYVLNSSLQLCPIGVFGEICITGEGLAIGYINLEALTKERFVPNPYEPGQLMYRTGDRGRWLGDGRVEYAGRADDQLKINGILVQPEAVRQQMLTHRAVKEAYVTGITVNGNKKLAAYYISSEPVSVVELRTHLLLSLPPAAIPGKFMELAYFPLNLNGKLDKQALFNMT
jgi:amino acid adenylation domain-containing protein